MHPGGGYDVRLQLDELTYGDGKPMKCLTLLVRVFRLSTKMMYNYRRGGILNLLPDST